MVSACCVVIIVWVVVVAMSFILNAVASSTVRLFVSYFVVDDRSRLLCSGVGSVLVGRLVVNVCDRSWWFAFSALAYLRVIVAVVASGGVDDIVVKT